MKKNLIAVVLAVLVASLVSACATLSVMPTEDELSTLKGQAKDTILAKYGQPDGKFTDAKGNKVWIYKRPAASQEGKNTLVKVTSMGFYSGSNSAYVDIWKITFNKDKVTSVVMEENVMNVSIPGMSNSTSQN